MIFTLPALGMALPRALQGTPKSRMITVQQPAASRAVAAQAKAVVAVRPKRPVELALRNPAALSSRPPPGVDDDDASFRSSASSASTASAAPRRRRPFVRDPDRDQRRLDARRARCADYVAREEGAPAGVLAEMVDPAAASSPTYKDDLRLHRRNFRAEVARVTRRRTKRAELRGKLKAAGRAAIATAMFGMGLGGAGAAELEEGGLGSAAKRAREALLFGDDGGGGPASPASPAAARARSPPAEGAFANSEDESRRRALAFVYRNSEARHAESAADRRYREARESDEAEAEAQMRARGDWQRLTGLRARAGGAGRKLDDVEKAILKRLTVAFDGNVFAANKARVEREKRDKKARRMDKIAEVNARNDELAVIARLDRDRRLAALVAPVYSVTRDPGQQPEREC